jgi:hypothetical protein
MTPLLPPSSIARCSAKSRSFFVGPGGPTAASTWTSPAPRRSHGQERIEDRTRSSQSECPRFEGNPGASTSIRLTERS